jgi:hypothetical protein
MALNVVSSERLSTNVKTSNLDTGLSDKVGENKNLIINGAFNVAQRGTSSTSTSYKTVDRFLNSINGGTVTQAQHALTSSDTGPWAKGFRNSYHQTNTSASSDAAANFRNIYYYVEAQDLANSGWDYTSSSSYITLSFWAKSSLAGTYYIQLRSQDGTGQNYASPYTLVADTWKKITVKIPGNSNIQVDNNNGAGLQIYWVLDYGTNFTGSMSTDTWAAYSSSTRTPDFAQDWTGTASATFEITGVQLEVGDTATEFEHRTYGDELARCQRYYEGIYMNDGTAACKGYASYGSNANFEYQFAVQKRARATWSLEGNASWAGATPNAYESTSSCMFQVNDGTLFSLGDTADDLCGSFSAEL